MDQISILRQGTVLFEIYDSTAVHDVQFSDTLDANIDSEVIDAYTLLGILTED